MLLEITVRIRLGHGEEAVVETHLGVERVRGADPVNGALDLAPGGRAAGLAVQVGGATEFGDVAVGVLHHFLALDDVGVFEAHFAAGFEAEEFGRRHFHEVVLLDEQFAREGNLPLTCVLVPGVVGRVEFLDLALGVVGDDDLDWPQHSETPQTALVQVLTDGVFEHGHVGQAVVFRDADVVSKRAQRLRHHAAPPQSADRGHPWIVPAVHEPFVDELHELALAHHGVAEAEARELVLVRQRTRQL